MSNARRAMRVALSMIVAVAALLTLAPSLPAFADQPQFFEFQEDFTYVHEGECAFNVIEHTEGITRMMYHPNNGNPFAALYHYELRGTYTNADTGQSISWSQDALLKGFYQDQSLIIFSIGLYARVTVPGQGMVAIDAGRLTIRLTPGAPYEVLFQAGRWDPFSAVCSALQ